METIVMYTKLTPMNKAAIYYKWLPILPIELRNKNLKLHNLDDRIRNLLGKLLLIKILEYVGYNKISLNDLYYNEFGKPYLSPDFDFNISHSGSYVFCAISKNQIGIDIEEILPLDFKQVKETMNETEWFKINNAQFPLREYYRYWTIKEAVIKADGRGFFLALNQYEIKNNQMQIEGKTWYIQEFFFDKNYCGCNATEQLPIQNKMIYIALD